MCFRMKSPATTLAIIDALDVIVAVDTSSAHVAGLAESGSGFLCTNSAVWRWGDSGDRTPWYPSARIFRQHEPGNWAPVVRRIATELAIIAEAQLRRLAYASPRDALGPRTGPLRLPLSAMERVANRRSAFPANVS